MHHKPIVYDNLIPYYNKDLLGTQQSNSYVKVFEYSFSAAIINEQVFNQFTGSGGSIQAEQNYGNTCQLSISTSVGSYSTLRTKRPLIYRAGSTCRVNGACRFPSEAVGLDNSLVFIGAGNAQCDLYFCYSNGVFGIRRGTQGLLHIVKLTITAAASGAETATIVLNGVSYTASLTNAGGTISFTAHQVEDGDDYSASWNLEHVGNTIVFVATSVGARSGTYSFSSTGTATGTFSTLKTGQSITEFFVPLSECNGTSVMKTSVNPLAWNMYEIEYLFYGVGNIQFKIYNPSTSRYEVVHTLTFANKATDVSLSSQNMFYQSGVASLGASTAMTLNISSINTGYLDGGFSIFDGVSPFYNINTGRSLTAGVERVITVIQNRYEVNGFSNVSELYLTRLNITADGTKPVLIKVIKNPATLSANTLADYTNYVYVDEEGSPLIYDTTALTYSGGTQIFSLFIGINDNENYVIRPPILISREDIFIITGLSSNSNTVSVSLDVIQDSG